MKSVFKKSILAATLVLSGILLVGQAFAQADSTTGNGALNWRAIIPLYAQERETPVVNNNSYPTTNVTQNITQSATPDIFGVDSGWIDAITGGQHTQGSGPWMVTGGHRACQAYGYASGYVVEYFGGRATVACYR